MQMVEKCSGNLWHMLFHCEFGVEIYSEITNEGWWLDCLWPNAQGTIVVCQFLQFSTWPKPNCFSLFSIEHPFFTGRMPFLSPNQQWQSTEEKRYHIPWTCSPRAHLGSATVTHTYLQTDGRCCYIKVSLHVWINSPSVRLQLFDSSCFFPIPKLPSINVLFHRSQWRNSSVYAVVSDAASQWEMAILGMSELHNPWPD